MQRCYFWPHPHVPINPCVEEQKKGWEWQLSEDMWQLKLITLSFSWYYFTVTQIIPIEFLNPQSSFIPIICILLCFFFIFSKSFLPPCIQRLLSEVEVSVSVEDKAVGRYSVSISPLCPEGSTAKDRSCSGVQPNQTVNTQASPHELTTGVTTGKRFARYCRIWLCKPRQLLFVLNLFDTGIAKCEWLFFKKSNLRWITDCALQRNIFMWFCGLFVLKSLWARMKTNGAFIFRAGPHPLLSYLLHWSTK